MAGMDVQAVLTANAAGFIGPMNQAAAAATATGRATAKAAKDAAAAQAIAAKYAGDAVSAQSLRLLAARKAESESGRDYSALSALLKRGALDEASGNAALAAALAKATAARREANAVANAGHSSHGSFSDQMAASATIRELSGNAGIRSVERFVTILPGAAGALRALFPIIGAAGLTGLLVDMGEKGYEAFQKITNGTYLSRDAYQATHDKAAVTIDDLELENQKIQDQIDKISGHPNNGLAAALLEARKMADQLVVSLQEDRKQLEALLKENSTGVMGRVLGSIGVGPASTSDQDKDLLNDQGALTTKLRTAKQEFDEATAGVLDPAKLKAAGDRYKQAVSDTFDQPINQYHVKAAQLKAAQQKSEEELENSTSPYGNGTVDNSNLVQNLEGRAKQLEGERFVAMLQAQILTGTQKLGAATQAKENAGLGDKAAEAQRKADEARMKAMEAALEQLKLNGNVTAKAEYDYWNARRNAFATGSDQYNQVVAKQVAIASEGARKAGEEIEKVRRSIAKGSGDDGAEAKRAIAAVNENYLKSLQDLDKARDTHADTINEVDAINARAAATRAETAINEAAGRTLSRQDALRQLSILHAQQYSAEIDRLNAKAAQVAGASYLSNPEKQSQLRQIQTQGANIEAQRQSTLAKDQYALHPPDSSALVGGRDALDALADAARDSSKQLQDFTTTSLERFNSGLLQLLTHRNQRGDHVLRNTAADIARSGTGALLKKGEGYALNALGFGKAPKGTAGDPLHVVIASGLKIPGITGGTASKDLGGAGVDIMSLLYPGGNSDTTSPASTGAKVGAGVAGALSSILSHIPGFADGTPAVSEDTLAIVGERGPELAYLSKGTGIVPNHRVSEMFSGGGGARVVNHIDARGAHDPVATRAQIDFGLQQAAPRYISGAVAAMKDNNARRPRTSRG